VTSRLDIDPDPELSPSGAKQKACAECGHGEAIDELAPAIDDRALIEPAPLFPAREKWKRRAQRF